MPVAMTYTMGIGSFFTIMLSMVLVSNFVLSRFLGLCPFIGVTKRTDSAVGMGMAVTFVMTLASSVTWVVYHYVLLPQSESGFNVFAGIIGSDTSLVSVLKTVSYILVIATLVQLVELVMRKTVPALYQALGIYLPLITTNCAVLGVALLNLEERYSLIGSVVDGFSAGIGFTLALLLMSGIRERLELADVPKSFKGLPIAFISAALLALAFMAFTGMRL